jgi:putative peptide zinc metalloprotease protein
MATLADSLRTSSGRPLALHKRSDLTVRQQRYQGRNYWVIKEPIGLKYFRFQEEEYAILQMFDGQVSFDDVRERFQERFAPQKVTLNDLQQFIGMLHRNGLVVSTTPGQGAQLKRRRDERARKELLGKFSNVLAIRFKGIDPERFLNWIYPWTKWVFSPITVTLCILLALAALSLVLVQFDVFREKLPAFHEFFGAKNWLLLAGTLALTKVLHELGHGLSCKHFGGECHEIGVMFLVLTPCLFCNVSDSWMLPSKWQRAAIGAAGMYVELVLASLATFVWWNSEVGTMNHLALRVMFICSVSTVLFNGNPLLRFDGYYIMSDIVEIPNLRQKATSIMNRILAKWCLGMELPEEPFLPQRNHFFFALYTIAAVAYRWIILFSILLFLYKVFEPYGLQVIGQMIALTSIGSLVVVPLWKMGKFLYTPGRLEQVKMPHLYATIAVVVTIITAIVMIPLPYHVTCSVEIRPCDAAPVYVEMPGRLEEVYIKQGDQVTEKTLLAKFRNLDLEMALATLAGQEKQLELQTSFLEHARAKDRRAGEKLLGVRESLAAIQKQLAEKQDEFSRLTILAGTSGTVLPPPARPDRRPESGQLPTWSGSLLEPKNLGATVTEATLLCEIGDPQRMEAVLVIDQGDIEMIKVGDHVEVNLEALPSRIFTGKIEELAKTNLEIVPQSLSNQAGGELATRTDASGVPRPLSTSYRARVPLDDPDGLLLLDLRGRAKIAAGWRPLGSRIWRTITHTFHFLL